MHCTVKRNNENCKILLKARRNKNQEDFKQNGGKLDGRNQRGSFDP